jgi:hypothetical protein
MDTSTLLRSHTTSAQVSHNPVKRKTAIEWSQRLTIMVDYTSLSEYDFLKGMWEIKLS